jgi:lysozyme
VAAGSAAVLAVVVVLAWLLARDSDRDEAGARPRLLAGESYGVDVSSHQGAVDWQRVKADGIAFAYLKASEGGDFVDERFAENWTAARDAGVARGAYHFFTLCRPGSDQAAQFLRVAAPEAAALAPAVDLELIGNCAARPSPAAVAVELQAFLSRVEAAWRRPVLLYVGPEWEDRYPVAPSARPRWVKATDRPAGRWAVWQLRALANVDGIAEPVDLDVGRVGELD